MMLVSRMLHRCGYGGLVIFIYPEPSFVAGIPAFAVGGVWLLILPQKQKACFTETSISKANNNKWQNLHFWIYIAPYRYGSCQTNIKHIY